MWACLWRSVGVCVDVSGTFGSVWGFSAWSQLSGFGRGLVLWHHIASKHHVGMFVAVCVCVCECFKYVWHLDLKISVSRPTDQMFNNRFSRPRGQDCHMNVLKSLALWGISGIREWHTKRGRQEILRSPRAEWQQKKQLKIFWASLSQTQKFWRDYVAPVELWSSQKKSSKIDKYQQKINDS